MAASTADQKDEGRLKSHSSSYLKMDALRCRPTALPGVEIKVLLEDKDTRLMTSVIAFIRGSAWVTAQNYFEMVP